MHLFIGLFVVLLLNLNLFSILPMIISLFLFSILLSVFTKLAKPKLILFMLKWFDKPEDVDTFPGKGAVFYLAGILLSLLFFDSRIASAAIIILAVGDPAAHIIGKYYGKKKIIINNKKLLEGTMAGTLLGTFAASIFMPIPIAFFGAASGMMAEAFDIQFLHLDDNLFIPLTSGLVMTIIQSLI